MQLTIDFDSKIPLYTQIRDAIVSGIATGDLTNGTI
ncbi:MAG: GntR family transcriptional regulator, partial [Lacticaseibacillus paracasei]